MHTILGLDISSRYIGWSTWDGRAALAYGTIDLTVVEGIARLSLAETATDALIRRHAPDAVGIEAPAYSSHELVAQQRVVGVVLLCIVKAGLMEMEVSPGTAKKALSGYGRASKKEMIEAAALWLDQHDYDEHAADALAVAFVAHGRAHVMEAA